MKSNEMAALSIWDMGFFEIESRQRHAQRLSSFHHSSPSHVLYTPPALPHCSQGSPHTPSTHSCPAQPNIYAFTYVLVLYIRSPPAEKKGRNGLANQLGPVLGPFQAREITRLKGSHVYVLHHNPLNVTDGGFLDPPDCAFTQTEWAKEREVNEALRAELKQARKDLADTDKEEDDSESKAGAGLATANDATADVRQLERCEKKPPRKWDVLMTKAWVLTLDFFSPDEKQRLNNAGFRGYDLVGSNSSTGTKPLTVDVLHKATCVIQHWTPAEFTAAMAKVDITGNAPEFERAIDNDASTLFDLFFTQSIEAIIGDYFNTDELRPLAKRLWAHLTLIDDESKCDARRMFASLKPELTKLQVRQQDEDSVDESKKRTRNRAQVGRSYGVAQNDDAQLSDSDNEDGGDGGDGSGDGRYGVAGGNGDGGSDDDDGSAKERGASTDTETKRSAEDSLDLVTAAFHDTNLEDRVSKTQMKNKYYMLERWVKAFESNDWASMTMVCKEFVHTAANLCQRIIEDKVSMGDLRCFLPKNMGGIAGGKKFIEKSILIKFAGKSQRWHECVWMSCIVIVLRIVCASLEESCLPWCLLLNLILVQ